MEVTWIHAASNPASGILPSSFPVAWDYQDLFPLLAGRLPALSPGVCGWAPALQASEAEALTGSQAAERGPATGQSPARAGDSLGSVSQPLDTAPKKTQLKEMSGDFRFYPLLEHRSTQRTLHHEVSALCYRKRR
ncbi:uncharacterized protein LOC143682681 [Tamandua tetradactyla]|uniref:uncharacterized protein LOC143682681 n=1 Tax=Tamandua tetradactyla TaxID=48850 RepID=UPI0040538F3E